METKTNSKDIFTSLDRIAIALERVADALEKELIAEYPTTVAIGPDSLMWLEHIGIKHKDEPTDEGDV